MVTRGVILGLSLIGAAAASVNTLLTSLLVRRLVRLVTADVARYLLRQPGVVPQGQVISITN